MTSRGISSIALSLPIFAAIFAGFGAVSTAYAGELDVENGQPVWSSTTCIQPVAPQVDKADAQALNASINRYNRFVGAVDEYNQCLRTEADSDLVSLRQSINDSVQALQAGAIAAAGELQAAINAPRGPDEPATESVAQ